MVETKTGQSVLEYTLVFAVIIAAIIVASTKIKSSVDKSYDQASVAMNRGADNFPKYLGS